MLTVFIFLNDTKDSNITFKFNRNEESFISSSHPNTINFCQNISEEKKISNEDEKIQKILKSQENLKNENENKNEHMPQIKTKKLLTSELYEPSPKTKKNIKKKLSKNSPNKKSKTSKNSKESNTKYEDRNTSLKKKEENIKEDETLDINQLKNCIMKKPANINFYSKDPEIHWEDKINFSRTQFNENLLKNHTRIHKKASWSKSFEIESSQELLKSESIRNWSSE